MCNILLASWRTSTAKGTQAHGKHGLPGVVKGENVPVNDIMDFLSFQFQQRYLAYQTIGIYKSCISRFHGLVEGQPVRSLPVMSRFMKGIFELQPPKPKTKTTWSVGQTVVFRQDMNPFGNLSLQDVSLKLAMLLALTSAARVHELMIALSLATIIKNKIAGDLFFLYMTRIPDQTIQEGRHFLCIS